MTELTSVVKSGNGGRWMALGVIIFVVAAFIGSYTFISTNFVSRREYEHQLSQAARFVSREEFDQVRAEQARRTPIVFGSIAATERELSEIRRRLEHIEAALRRAR